MTSPAFRDGQPIPRDYTCQGRDVSPPLVITQIPAAASHLALILDDPDAPRGTWTHWTFWDLPAENVRLAEGQDVAALRAMQGRTSARSIGYHGPCPPTGTHRYYVHVYALGARLGLTSGAAVAELRAALANKAIAHGVLMGTYAQS